MRSRRSLKTRTDSLSKFSEDFMEERNQPPVQGRAASINEMKLVPFSSAFDVMSDKGRRVKQRDYLPEGTIPVIDQGQTFIGGYTNEQDLSYGDTLPVIIFGDHTKKIKLVNQPFAVGADGVKILKPKPDFVPKFLYYFLQIVDLPDKGYARHFQFLRKAEFPYTLLKRQEEIVAEIEKQFSRLDEAVAGLKRIKANLKRYKAAVLKAAVEGKLTEEWRKAHPNVETGAELLKRILAERKKKWEEKNPGKKYKEPAAPDTSNLPALPEGWVWATIEQVAALVTDGDHNPPKRTATGVRHLTAKHVREWRLEPTDCTYISKEAAAKVFKRYAPQAGDLMVTCVGTVGRTAIVPEGFEFSPDRNLAAVRLLPRSVDAKFIQLDLESPDVQRVIKTASGSTAQPHLYLADLRTLSVPLPSLSEQQQIVAEVNRFLSLASEVETQVDINLKRSERLRQGILKKAFSGELH